MMFTGEIHMIADTPEPTATATATVAPTPSGSLLFGPKQIRFPDQIVGAGLRRTGIRTVSTSSHPQNVVLRNPRELIRHIYGFNSSVNLGFTETNNCPPGIPSCFEVIPAEQSCSVPINFAPTNTGKRIGSLMLSGGSPTKPEQVDLVGIGG
jgi:hypothetical protein